MATIQPATLVVQDSSPNWNKPLLVACKRALDFAASVLLLVLLAPVFLVLAIAVKLSSPGPVFYRWRVVGERGRPFTGYKFRSMFSNADEMKQKLQALNEMSGPGFKLTKEPRVSKVGGFLRLCRLEEW